MTIHDYGQLHVLYARIRQLSYPLAPMSKNAVLGSEIDRRKTMKNIKFCLKWVEIGRGEPGISTSGSKNDAEFDFDGPGRQKQVK